MSARFNLVLSDDLNEAIDAVAAESETNKSEILQGPATVPRGPRGQAARSHARPIRSEDAEVTA